LAAGFFIKNLLAIEPEIGANHSKIVLIFWHVFFGLATSFWINDILPGIALWLPDYLFGPDMSR